MNLVAYTSDLWVDLSDWVDVLQLGVLLYLLPILGGTFPILGQCSCLSWDLPVSSLGRCFKLKLFILLTEYPQ